MRVLVVGAGGVGGYFGGRLLEKGANITFLVRERRKQQLIKHGLVIRSIHGDVTLPAQTLSPGEPSEPFDLVILSVKAYHLEEAIRSCKPYVDQRTSILPLLNGMGQIETLQREFGKDAVLGGLCFIESTLNNEGIVEQYSPEHNLLFGELDGTYSPRVEKISQLFAGANFTARASKQIVKRMWHKFIYIATVSGITTITRSSLGPIFQSPYGKEILERLFHEVVSIARNQEPTIDEDLVDQLMRIAERTDPTFKSSMLRDLEKGNPIETDHFHGYLLNLAPKDTDLPILKMVYHALKIANSPHAPLPK